MKFYFSFKFQLPLIFFITFLFYFQSFNYFFSQDDFIHLDASKAQNFGQFLNFFNPYAIFEDIFQYRPLSTQLYFFLNNSFFSINHLPFRIEILLFHFINIYLFYLLVFNTIKDKKVALLSSLFYGVSAVHFLSIFYISSFQQILKSTFIFLSILSFQKYVISLDKKLIVISLLSFVAALISKETSIILPLLIIPLDVIRVGNIKFKLFFSRLWPFLLISIFYLLIKVFSFQATFNQGGYQITTDIFDLTTNLKWYFLWIFGLPEALQFYPSLKPLSLIQFSKGMPFGIATLTSFFILFISALILFVKNVIPKKLLFILALLFFIPLLPVLFLKNHSYPQYLDLSLLAFLPLLSLLIINSKTKALKILSMLTIFSFLGLQFFSIQLSIYTHWTTYRSDLAYKYYQYLLVDHPSLPANTTIIFNGRQDLLDELKVALANMHALRVWYPEKVKEVLYLQNLDNKNLDAAIIIPLIQK